MMPPLKLSRQFLERPKPAVLSLSSELYPKEKPLYYQKPTPNDCGDGDISAFDKTKKAETVRRQLVASVENLKEFLGNNSNSANSEEFKQKISKLQIFGGRVNKGVEGFFSTQVENIYSHIKADLEIILQEARNDLLPLEARVGVVSAMADEVHENKCIDGLATAFSQARDELVFGGGDLREQAKSILLKMLYQHVKNFCTKRHADDPNYIGNEVHYVNAYRNHLARRFGATEQPDSSIPPDTWLHKRECASYVGRNMNPEVILNTLAENCFGELRAEFAKYLNARAVESGVVVKTLDEPLTEEEMTELYGHFKKELLDPLQSKYGALDVSLAMHGLPTSDNEPKYGIVSNSTLVTRAIAKNLCKKGIYEPFKMEVVETLVREENYSVTLKKAPGNAFYVKKKSFIGSLYSPLQTDDLPPDLARKELLKAALLNTTDSMALKRFSPDRVFSLLCDDRSMLHPDWVQMISSPEVRRYRQASLDNERRLLNMAHEQLKKLPRKATGDAVYQAAYLGDERLALPLMEAAAALIDPRIPESNFFLWKDRQGNVLFHVAARRGLESVTRKILSSDRGASSLALTNSEGGIPLFDAVKNGHVAVMDMLLAKAPDQANFCSPVTGETPLMNAVGFNQRRAVEKLLEKGAYATIGNENREGRTALMIAALVNDKDIIETLLKAAPLAFVHRSRNGGETPLMTAASRGNVGALNALLHAGASDTMSLTNDSGHTALSLAAFYGHADVIKILALVDKREASRVLEPDNETPLIIAAMGGHVEAVKALLEAGAAETVEQIQHANAVGNTAMIAAAGAGHVDVVKMLAQAHPRELNRLVGPERVTPLKTAVYYGDFDTVKAMLEAGAEIEVENSAGYTAMLVAAETGNVPIIELLAQAKPAEVNRPNQLAQMTPLMMAARNGRRDAIEALLKAGAGKGVEDRSAEGATAMDLAISSGHFAVAERLAMVQALADAGQVNRVLPPYGHTPLMVAVYMEDLDSVKKLLETSTEETIGHVHAKGLTAAMMAARCKDVAILKGLLRARPAELDRVAEPSRQTLLMMAAEHGQREALEILLEMGAAATIGNRDAGERTAMSLAAQYGRADVIKILARARPEEVNSLIGPQKDTPLTLAVQGGHLEAVKALLVAGARDTMPHRNQSGWSAMRLAASWGNTAIIEALAQADPAEVIREVTPRKETPLMEVASRGQVDTLDLLLTLGAGETINAVNSDGWTAMMHAAAHGHVYAVEALLEAGAKVDVELEATGESALWLAVQNGQVSVVEMMLKADPAAVNRAGRNQDTPLMRAAAKGRLAAIQALLEAGARDAMDSVNADGWTAMMQAAAEGHVDTVGALLEAGAKIDIASPSGETALWLAVQKGHVGVVERLLKADPAAVNRTTGSQQETPLMRAAARGQLATLETLLKAGTRETVGHRNAMGDTALSMAAHAGHVPIIEALARVAPEEINRITAPGKDTPLAMAVRGRNLEAVKALLAAGAGKTMRHKNGAGETAMSIAVNHGDDAISEALVQGEPVAKAKLNETAKDGWTVLMRAAAHGHVDTVGALLEAGARTHIASATGETALWLAVQNGHVGVVERLLNAYPAGANRATGLNRDTPLMRAAAHGQLATLEALLKAGARKEMLETTNAAGHTAMSLAAWTGDVRIIEALAKADATQVWRVIEPNRETPLIAAVRGGHREAVQALLKAGAVLTIGTETLLEETAMRIAIARGDADLVEVLAAASTDEVQRIIGQEGLTPLMLAAQTGQGKVIDVLLQAGARKTLDQKNIWGETALTIAWNNGHANIVKQMNKDTGSDSSGLESLQSSELRSQKRRRLE